MADLVGVAHRGAVDRILEVFDEVSSSRRSSLVLVLGEPGSGKTRVVQEVFRELSAAERERAQSSGSGPWWPDQLVDPRSDLLHLRKAVRPPRVWQKPPAAIQTYGWVGIACDLGTDGRPVHAIEDALKSIEDDNEGIFATTQRRRRWLTRWTGPAVGTVGLTVDALGIFTSNPYLLAAGLVLTAMGGIKTVLAYRDAISRGSKERAAQRRVSDAATVGPGIHESDSLIGARGRATRLIRRMAASHPVVVVVDDAAWADEGTLGVVDDLLSLPHPVLILATAQPATIGPQQASQDGFGQFLSEAAYGNKVKTIDIPALSRRETAELLRSIVPRSNASLIDLIADWAVGNPLLVRGLLRLPTIARRVKSDGLQMTERALAAELEATPASVIGLFGRHWELLPEPVRRLLSIASEFRSPHLIPEATVRAYSATDGSDETEARKAHRLSRDPYHWVEKLTDWVDRFADPVLLRIATDQYSLDLDDRERAQASLLAFVTEVLANTEDWRELDDPAQRLVLSLHVRAAQEGFASTSDGVADSAVALAQRELANLEYESAIAHAALAEEWAAQSPGKEAETLWQARQVRASALLSTRRVDSAADLFAQVVQHLTALAPNEPRTLRARVDYAKALRYAGHEANAVSQLTAFLEQHRKRLGASDPKLLEAERLLASYLRFLPGRVEESIERLERLVSAYETGAGGGITGEGGRECLNSLGVSLRWVHRYDDALSVYDRLITACRLADDVGPNHPQTLRASNNRAAALRRMGRLHEALLAHRDVLNKRIDVLGPTHKSTLISRNNLGQTLHFAQRDLEAIEELEALLRDRERVLGETNPSTIITAGSLADALLGAGRLSDALGLYARVLEARKSRRGSAHRLTLTTRTSVAHARLLKGDFDAAIHALNLVIQDIGPDAWVALRLHARHLLGLAKRYSGLLGESILVLGDVKQKRESVFGASDQRTLTTATELAVSEYIATNDEVVALETLRSIIAQAKAAQFDTHHPIVLDATMTLGATLRGAGALAESVSSLESVWAQRTEHSGSSHPRTVAAQRELALSMRAAGMSEAARILREARQNARALDRDHIEQRRLDEASIDGFGDPTEPGSSHSEA